MYKDTTNNNKDGVILRESDTRMYFEEKTNTPLVYKLISPIVRVDIEI